ncbi:MAG: toxin-activating lysine-acyltransferase [Burkholderiales bacterium]|nr:toxin-activating lysine-acyltransferase [Burkholderiales bacterium]
MAPSYLEVGASSKPGGVHFGVCCRIRQRHESKPVTNGFIKNSVYRLDSSCKKIYRLSPNADLNGLTQSETDVTGTHILSSPADTEKTAKIRTRLQATIGQIALAMSMAARYRHQSLADLQHLVLDPLLRDRIAIASAKDSPEAETASGPLAGIAIWASVSDEVDTKIREQIKTGAFPVRLKPEDWASGDHYWLFDVIAPSQKMSTSVLANFKQVVKQGEVYIHPIVARMVDPELLKKMGVVADGVAPGLAPQDAAGSRVKSNTLKASNAA